MSDKYTTLCDEALQRECNGPNDCWHVREGRVRDYADAHWDDSARPEPAPAGIAKEPGEDTELIRYAEQHRQGYGMESKLAVEYLRVRSEGGGEKRAGRIAVYQDKGKPQYVDIMTPLWIVEEQHPELGRVTTLALCVTEENARRIQRALSPSGEKGWQQGAEAMREACAKVVETHPNIGLRTQLNLVARRLRALPIPEPPK
jgi:hypothetical protein